MKIKCRKCGDIIEGDKNGNLIKCKCGSVSIDEDPFICRINGNKEDIIYFDNPMEDPKPINVIPYTNKPDRPNKINYYLDIAETISERSTCLKRKYGAIIVKNDEIIATGYNGAPRGLNSCLDKGYCNRENSERGRDYSECPSVHAEMNAIISASRKDMIGAEIYIVGKNINDTYVDNPAPCSLCKRLLINSGIKYIYIRTGSNNIDYECGEVNWWKESDIIGGY